ncbi:MAG: hypothetical protein JWP58_2342 [Hymenobacter sp.]|nr:hypothetical protein [Hymenobacter sp.]
MTQLQANRELAEASIRAGALLGRRHWFNSIMSIVMPTALFGMFNAMCFEFIPRLNLMNSLVLSSSIAWIGYTIYCVYYENKLTKFDTGFSAIENEQVILIALKNLGWAVDSNPRTAKSRKPIITATLGNKTITALPVENEIYLNVIHDLGNIRRYPLTFGGNSFALRQVMEAIKTAVI